MEVICDWCGCTSVPVWTAEGRRQCPGCKRVFTAPDVFDDADGVFHIRGPSASRNGCLLWFIATVAGLVVLFLTR